MKRNQRLRRQLRDSESSFGRTGNRAKQLILIKNLLQTRCMAVKSLLRHVCLAGLMAGFGVGVAAGTPVLLHL